MGKSEEGRSKDIDEEKENNSGEQFIVLLCVAITEIKPQRGFFFCTLVII
jgi:hypothetical protein